VSKLFNFVFRSVLSYIVKCYDK